MKEILEKEKMAVELAQKASDLHVENQKTQADRYFRNADDLVEDCHNAMKAGSTAIMFTQNLIRINPLMMRF